MKTNWGLWMADATDTLKYAAAAALLMAGAAPAYYYIMYIPQRDALARQAQQAEADKGRMAADARQARYDSCISDATSTYSVSWDSNCNTRRENALRSCKNYGGSDKSCQKLLEAFPASNCTLPFELSDRLDKDLANGKQLCLAEFKAS